MSPLENIAGGSWQGPFPDAAMARAIAALEGGRLLFFPELTFALQADEALFLDPACSDGRAKNVSYDVGRQELKGAALAMPERERLKAMVARFAAQAQALVASVLPSYRPHLRLGRTSYRPVEVKARPASYRKDDSRLHVDAFPSRPNGGERILRVFSNVNPHGQARLWRVGEPFETCAKRFLPRLPGPFPGKGRLLQALGLTRGYRSLYDHYMLSLHDNMKADESYQRQCPQYEVPFPAATTWMVFTDQVSHAAMAGQYVFEQTFYLPVRALHDPGTAPLKVLERLLARELVA